MSNTSSQDRERRINVSINRLISQIAPSTDVDDEAAQRRQDELVEEIKNAFRE
jgi:hypothetical protein